MFIINLYIKNKKFYYLDENLSKLSKLEMILLFFSILEHSIPEF